MTCPKCAAPLDASAAIDGETVSCAACGLVCELHDDFTLDLASNEEKPVLILEPLTVDLP